MKQILSAICRILNTLKNSSCKLFTVVNELDGLNRIQLDKICGFSNINSTFNLIDDNYNYDLSIMII